MKRSRAVLPQTREAAAVLGMLVAEGRRRRGWTEAELAQRVGVTPKTLRKVETGDPTVALGTALEAAALVGVPLFSDPRDLSAVRERVADRLALLPQRVRVDNREVHDDF
jgi:DNA-binding XRE family transcriptional regulator